MVIRQEPTLNDTYPLRVVLHPLPSPHPFDTMDFVGWEHMVIRSYYYLEDLYRYPGVLLLLAEEAVAIWLIAHLYG